MSESTKNGAAGVLIWWVAENEIMHPCSDLAGALWLVATIRTWCAEARIVCEAMSLSPEPR